LKPEQPLSASFVYNKVRRKRSRFLFSS